MNVPTHFEGVLKVPSTEQVIISILQLQDVPGTRGRACIPSKLPWPYSYQLT